MPCDLANFFSRLLALGAYNAIMPKAHSQSDRAHSASQPSLAEFVASLDPIGLRQLKYMVAVRLKEIETMTVKCVQCEQFFKPSRHWQKFCSTKCKNDHYWATHKVVKVPDEGVEEIQYE